jgi:hypothetical protein
MQGHLYANFANPTVLPMLLRGVAWAANYPIDSLANPVVRGRGAGGRGAGRRGRGSATPDVTAPGGRARSDDQTARP